MKRRSKGRLKLPRKVKRILTVCITCLAIALLIGAFGSLLGGSGSSGGGGSGTTRPPGTILGPSGGSHDPIIPDVPSDPEEEPEEPELVGSEGLEYLSNNDGTCTVIGIGTFTGTDLVIPSRSPAGDKVTSIANYAFTGKTTIKKVTFPSTLKTFGFYCFAGCTGLTEVVIPDTVQKINLGAFKDCTKIQEMTLPFTGESRESDYGFLAFVFGANSYSDTSFVPKTLVRVILTGDRLAQRAFYNIDSLVQVVFKGQPEKIPNYAFYDCDSLSVLTGDKGNSDVILPSSVKEIGQYAFYSCESFSFFELPEAVERIDSYAFAGCTALCYVSCGECLTYIGYCAFFSCTNLSYMNFPEHLEYLGNESFSGTKIVSSTASSYSVYISDWLYMSKGYSSVTVKSGTYGIAAYAFYYSASQLTKVVFSDTVVRVEGSAFLDCTKLQSVTLSNSLQSIGNNAFSGCSSLKSLTLPSSLEKIGMNAFASCTGLSSVVFSDSENWYVGDSSVGSEKDMLLYAEELGYTNTASLYLVSTYKDKYWIKKTVE